jgi:hypothetical protein
VKVHLSDTGKPSVASISANRNPLNGMLNEGETESHPDMNKAVIAGRTFYLLQPREKVD